MKKTKKLLCLFLAMVILIPNIAIFSNAVDAEQAEVSEPLLIEVTTDKSSYTAYGIAGITVKVTNTSDEAINNISAEAVFEQLAPVGKDNETFKEVETLQPNESFEFSYKATVNSSKVKINFFAKIFLWFTRLFNGGYTATSHDIEADIENVTEIKFGKYTVQNVVRVEYIKLIDKINNADFNAFQDVRKSIENLTIKDEVITVLENEIKKGNIKNYQVDEAYITYETSFGIKGIWEDESFFDKENKSVSLGDKDNTVSKTPSGNSYSDIINQVSTSSIVSSIGDVAVIRPYRSTDFQYDDFLTTGEIIADTIGTEIDVFDNADATLSILENLDRYGIVLIDSHGSLISGKPYICLTQTFNNQQIDSSDLAHIYVNQNNQIRVHSGFFADNYADDAFGDCLVFLGTCYSMYDSSFSDVLVEKGVDCIYGYTNVVSCSYCNNTLVENMLENLLLDGDSSSKAYNETVYNCGKTDPKNKNTDFVMRCSNNITIYGMLNGIVTESVGTANNPLANVTVTAENDNYKVIGKTDENGKFTLKLPLGKYTISLSLENYTNTISEPRTIIVEADTSDQLLHRFSMKRDNSSGGDTDSEKASVHGMVKDEKTGNAISGVRVEFIDNSTDNYDTVATATTGADGSFSVELPYGSYSMSFNHDDYEYYGESIEVDTEIVALTEPVLLTPKNSSGGDDDSGETDEPVITVVNSGDCGADGSNVTWTLYSDGTLVISGNGAMADYDDYDYNYNPITPFSYERLRIKKVIISDGITKVGMNAFAECYNITDLHIGKNVLTIGAKAFYDCESLTNITIPDSVTTIGALAFAECDNVTNLHIGNSVTTIGNRAFDFCENITSVTIPDSVTTIGDNAFRYCYNLANITIPDSVTTIGASAFDTTLFYNTESNWEKDVLYIDNHLIDAKETLSGEYIIEKGTITISPYAFGGCENLTIVTIPDSVITIGDGAFCYCKNLTSVTISDNVTTIGNRAFEMCSNITNLYIGKNVTTIGREAFRLCGGITSVTIPDNVTTIGDYAFESCSNITNLYIGKNLTTIANGAFYGCQALTSVKIPDSVTTIGDSAFGCCFGIKDFHIGKGVTTIGDYRPIGSFNLINITVDENNNYFCSDERGVLFNKAKTLLIQYPCANTEKSYTIPNSVEIIDNLSFDGCDNLTNITIADSVKAIRDCAFYDCDNLTSITIPDSVITIGNRAFERCFSVIDLYIGNGVTSIGAYAFGDCYVLTDLYIGNSVTTISDHAFDNCNNLTSVTIPNSVTSIGDHAFFSCDSLTSIKVDADNEYYSCDTYGVLFNKNKTELIHYPSGNTRTNYIIPNSVTNIGDWAFYYCRDLTSVTIPDSVTNIGDYAFGYCPSLTDVYYSGTKEDWNAITISNGNEPLTNATIHYNSKI